MEILHQISLLQCTVKSIIKGTAAFKCYTVHIIRVSITGNYVHWQLDVCISGKDQKAAPVCVVQCDFKLSVINQIQIVVSWKKEVVLQMILNCASSYVFQTWMDSKVVRIALHEEHFFRVEVLACSKQWVISMSQWPIFSGKHNVNRATYRCRLSQLSQILDCERNRKKRKSEYLTSVFCEINYCHQISNSSQAVYSIWQYNTGFKAFLCLWLAWFY